MSPIVYFISGIIIGILGWNYTRKKSRVEIDTLTDQKIRLQQEKEIIVDFMHNLAVAIGEGVDKNVLYQRIAHTAVMTTGAISACVYEKMESGKLQSIATEGLFPPQRKLKAPAGEANLTRARF